VQKYWKSLLERVRPGEIDRSVIITHRAPLSEAPQMSGPSANSRTTA
jgi:hypothetical protein